MKRSIIKKWNPLFSGLLLVGILMACNGNQEGENVEEDANVDAVAEPMPTPPVGEVEEGLEVERNWEAVLQDYIDVKDALVEDDLQQAREEASHMLERFNAVAEEELNRPMYRQLQSTIAEVANAQNIDSQRKSFHELSNHMYLMAQEKDFTEQTLYWQHCPMAMENMGANWLSLEEQVQNPYMGQEMPRCGRVEETIN